MPGTTDTPSPFAINAELALKLGTVALGSLYVLGLLISNLQLTEVGVSDFSSLQARNIMTGFLFVFYLIFLLLMVAPWSVVVYGCWRSLTMRATWGRRLLLCAQMILGAALVTLSVAVFASVLFGYFYPWGRTWAEAQSRQAWTWEGMNTDYRKIFVQFIDTFGHLKIAFAAPSLVVALIYPVRRVALAIRKSRGLSEEDQSLARQVAAGLAPFLPIFFGVFITLSFVLSMVSFAHDTYPNVKHALGGGQPDVAELEVGTKTIAGIKLREVATAKDAVVGPGSGITLNLDVASHTDALVIWHQSDKFLYVTPLPPPGQTVEQLIAVDLRLVRAIQYLPKVVRVGQGGTILHVYTPSVPLRSQPAP